MIDMALQIVKVIVSQSETESVTSQLDQMRPLTTGDDLYFPLLDQKKKKKLHNLYYCNKSHSCGFSNIMAFVA